MKTISPLGLGCFIFATPLSIGCGTPADGLRVTTTSAEVSPVVQRRTYFTEEATVPPTGGFTHGTYTPTLLRTVSERVDLEMGNRGYRFSKEASDVIVRIAVGHRKSAEQWREEANGPEVERGITVEAFQRSNGEKLYEGFVRYDTSASGVDKEKVRAAVAKVLTSLPPASS